MRSIRLCYATSVDSDAQKLYAGTGGLTYRAWLRPCSEQHRRCTNIALGSGNVKRGRVAMVRNADIGVCGYVTLCTGRRRMILYVYTQQNHNKAGRQAGRQPSIHSVSFK